MTEFITKQKLTQMPRLPLEGKFDLTYRCNNNCRHCWLRIPPGAPEKKQELTLDEIMGIVDDARKMGCRSWSFSGGEPMLRPDFPEIFDYITSKSTSYNINTNGTLITPDIAEQLTRKGAKMIALYGATAEVNDHVTRNKGSFEATMQGFKLLQDAGASFIVQVIPMRDNFHQLDDMIKLAESLSPTWRIGAPWLYLSSCGDPKVNAEIRRQRLDPKDVIDLDKPDVSFEEATLESSGDHNYDHEPGDDRLFASCVEGRRDFHLDPYGSLSFCNFLKDPELRYDLRKGNFQEAWDVFIPSMADKVRGGKEYTENCGSCQHRSDCRWCPVYGFLEHRRFPAKVDYLCEVARVKKAYVEDWKNTHRRYFEIGGVNIRVDSDVPFKEDTFHPKLQQFMVNGPAKGGITVRHHFALPRYKGKDLGKLVLEAIPWAIYRKGDAWIYKGISRNKDQEPFKMVVFNEDHSKGEFYHKDDEYFKKGGLLSVSMFPSDQLLLARVLANKEGCYLHSGGVILNGKGLIFAGHSSAGKSTTVTMLKEKAGAEILCDDRNIIRRKGPENYMVHGTWSHGDIPDVSAKAADLKAILFLNQAEENRLELITNKREIIKRLLASIIKPFVTADWWEKELTLIENISKELPCYIMHFDKSGNIVEQLRELVKNQDE